MARSVRLLRLNKGKVAGILLLIVLALSTGTIYFLLANRGNVITVSPEEGSLPAIGDSYNLTVALAEGDRVVYDIYISITQANNLTEDTAVLNMTVRGFQWPDIEVAYRDAEGGETLGAITYTNLALPLEELGRERVALPVFLPVIQAAVCVELELEEVVETSWGEAYRYVGAIAIGEALIHVEADYLADTGILASINITLLDFERVVRSFFRQNLNDLDGGGGRTIVSTPQGWFCRNGYSSNLVFVYDGLIRIEGGEVYKANISEVVEALKGSTLFILLSKECPFCVENWPHILEASKVLEEPIYALVIGALTPEKEWRLGVNEASKAGVQGTPAFIVYRDGRVVAVREGVMPWEDIVRLVRDNLDS